MPRVSVLLTCYNHRAFIEAAVASVRAQAYRDFEIIAVDDGSSDGTREWLAEQSDITVICNPANVGTYETLNVAFRAASGEFVAILNDDDVWQPAKLSRQVNLMDSDPRIGLVHTGGFFVDGNGQRIDGNPLGFAFPRFKTGDILLGLVYENKIIASAALARRECFGKVGEFNRDYFGSGDWEMWWRIAEEYQVGFVDEELTQYRVHGSNASHKLDRIWKDDRRLREWIQTRWHHLNDRFSREEIARAEAFNWAALGTVRTLTGDPAGGRAAYAKSIRIQPTRWKSYARWIATFLPAAAFRRML